MSNIMSNSDINAFFSKIFNIGLRKLNMDDDLCTPVIHQRLSLSLRATLQGESLLSCDVWVDSLWGVVKYLFFSAPVSCVKDLDIPTLWWLVNLW